MFRFISLSLLLTRPLQSTHTAAPNRLDDSPAPPRQRLLAEPPPAQPLAGQEEEEEKQEVVLDVETPVAKTGHRAADDKETSSVAAAAAFAEKTVPQQLTKEADDSNNSNENTAQTTRYIELPNYNSEGGPIVFSPDGSIVPPREFVPFSGTLLDPRHSVFVTLESYLPLDVAFTEDENDDGAIRAAIIFDYGHGYRAGIRWKDRFRAVSACEQQQETRAPTANPGDTTDAAVDASREQQPQTTTTTTTTTKRFLYSCDGQHLEDVLAAIESNAIDPHRRPILIVVERSIVEKDN
jgi:hypothetical protein